MKRLLVSMLLLAALAGPAHAVPRPHAGAQFRYWEFSNDNDLRDWIAYVVPGPFHVQLEYWDFVRGEDQFRPEIGLHLRDARRSVYDFEWRHEKHQERFTIGTGQILNDRVVGRVSVSPIVPEDGPNEVVVSAGADAYWGSYNFASVTVIRDPRGEDLWVVPLRVRLANERNDWFQVTGVPTTDRTFGWAVDFKYRWLRAGVERNSRYDFTDLDNTITTIGFEIPWGPDPNEQ
jgi:hypothetical protein